MKHFEGWRTSATEIPARRAGRFRLRHEQVEGLERPYWGLDGIDRCTVSGTLTYLTEGDIEWMVDDPARQRVMELYAQAAEGNVLVGGLGLGLLANALDGNPHVTDIFISEVSSEIRSLVPIPRRATLLETDFWEVATGWPGFTWHTIIADLWDDRAAQRLDELHEEVALAAAAVRQEHPHAKLILHGFPALSDYDPLKEGASHPV